MSLSRWLPVIAAIAALAGGCDKSKPAKPTPTQAAVAAATSAAPATPQTVRQYKVTGDKNPLIGEGVSEAQVVGWSSDERRFALRQFDLMSEDIYEETEPCPGYIDHRGKPFMGTLTLQAYEIANEGMFLLESFTIQHGPARPTEFDPDDCTPPAEAKENLEAAKRRFAELGIDLEKKGTVVKLTADTPAKLNGPNGDYTLEYDSSGLSFDEEDEDGEWTGAAHAYGTHSLVMDQDGKRKILAQRSLDKEYGLIGAGYFSTGVSHVNVSPGGRAVVVIGHESEGNMRGSDKALFFWGAFHWKGDQLVMR